MEYVIMLGLYWVISGLRSKHPKADLMPCKSVTAAAICQILAATVMHSVGKDRSWKRPHA